MWGRRKSRAAEPAAEVAPDLVEVAGPRATGPFDVSERPIDTPEEYLDFGAILIKARRDIEVHLPAENDVVTAVLVTAENSAVELRPFAGSRTPGTWESVRAELLENVQERGGTVQHVDGPFGPELLTQFPATAEDGSAAVQPARFVGIEGPRWVLRATILGAAGLESTDEGLFMEVLRDLRVRRGDEPRLLREALPLTLPPDAQPADED